MASARRSVARLLIAVVRSRPIEALLRAYTGRQTTTLDRE